MMNMLPDRLAVLIGRGLVGDCIARDDIFGLKDAALWWRPLIWGLAEPDMCESNCNA